MGPLALAVFWGSMIVIVLMCVRGAFARAAAIPFTQADGAWRQKNRSDHDGAFGDPLAPETLRSPCYFAATIGLTVAGKASAAEFRY